jgi:hypothetical protein
MTSSDGNYSNNASRNILTGTRNLRNFLLWKDNVGFLTPFILFILPLRIILIWGVEIFLKDSVLETNAKFQAKIRSDS